MNLHNDLRFSPSSILHFQTITLLSCKTIVTIPSSHRRFTFLRRRHYGPNLKVVRDSMQEKEIKFLEAEEAELLMATCITRTLPPALTLDLGLEKIKDAVEELKSKPCCSKAGMYRFQIAVSPGSRALSWFCSQDLSLGVFPQFFVSTGVEKPTTKLLSFSRTRGIFGIGAAVYIKSPHCSASIDQIPFRRYQSIDSARLMAYGLLGHTSGKFENRSFYMFIPLIELVESDGLSILTATLAWDDSSLCLYEDAFDAIIYLTTALTRPFADECLNKCVSAVLRKFNMVGDKHAKMVYTDALLLRDGCLEHMELVSLLSWKMLHYPISSPSDFQLLSLSPITWYGYLWLDTLKRLFPRYIRRDILFHN